ncbi:hypothetical protein [Evansella tamaricis]|uniref:Uncharacterized protein n=1 Tax=Evansella tamaricis TaxID=2069301 RepID=A0ABS6J973_9BACI|nr:hypothetical protein [Evansella tamaricis]MBU9710241.1 hypothetical protein [Evansella tamaricis]
MNKKVFITTTLSLLVIIALVFFYKGDAIVIEAESLDSVHVNHGDDRTVVTDRKIKEDIVKWINNGIIKKQSESSGAYTYGLSVVMATEQETLLIEANIAMHDTYPWLQITHIIGDKQNYYTIESEELNSFLLSFMD